MGINDAELGKQIDSQIVKEYLENKRIQIDNEQIVRQKENIQRIDSQIDRQIIRYI